MLLMGIPLPARISCCHVKPVINHLLSPKAANQQTTTRYVVKKKTFHILLFMADILWLEN